MFLLSVGFGMAVSMTAVFLDEATFHRYESWRDLASLVLAALLEGVILRWVSSWWRLRGLFDAAAPRRGGWGKASRVGFGAR